MLENELSQSIRNAKTMVGQQQNDLQGTFNEVRDLISLEVFNKEGYPDFTPYAHPAVEPVRIKVSYPENRKKDFREANKAAGLNKNSDPPVLTNDSPPEGYTWHHHEDGTTMILIETEIHREFSHSGGVSAVKYRESIVEVENE